MLIKMSIVFYFFYAVIVGTLLLIVITIIKIYAVDLTENNIMSLCIVDKKYTSSTIIICRVAGSVVSQLTLDVTGLDNNPVIKIIYYCQTDQSIKQFSYEDIIGNKFSLLNQKWNFIEMFHNTCSLGDSDL